MAEASMDHLISIPEHKGSFALLSESLATDTAVVFVHGFAGGATSTWSQFHSLVDVYSSEFEWWKATDAYFYRYGSISKPVAVNAHGFRSFLDFVFPSPQHSIIDSVRSVPGGARYSNLVLVGHSEGAVVIRRALIETYKTLRETLVKFPDSEAKHEIESFLVANPVFAATLILFAPAYLGFSGAGWLQLLLHLPKISGIFNAALNFSTAYVELQKDSPVLKQVKDDTTDIAEPYPYMSAFKASPIFGAEDRIVYIGEYGGDNAAQIIDRHNHISICKPTPKYKLPLKVVRYADKRKASGI